VNRPSYPASPEHPFARFVRILGKGKTGSRSLSQAEAAQAFGMILRGADGHTPIRLYTGDALLLLQPELALQSACDLAGSLWRERDKSRLA